MNSTTSKTGQALDLTPEQVAKKVLDKRSKTPDLATLEAAGVATVAAFIDLEVNRTAILRQLAVIAVGIRSQVEYHGKPDWAGRSQQYRETVARIYEKAGVPTDSVSGFQSTLRNHISTVVRAAAPKAELEALGMHPTDETQRAVGARRQARTAGDGTRPTAGGGQGGDGSGDGAPPVVGSVSVDLTSDDPVHLTQQAINFVQRAQSLPRPTDDVDLRMAVMTLLGTVQNWTEQLVAIDVTAREQVPA